MVRVRFLFLVIFGPGKLPSMARDLERFGGEARGYMDGFKSELLSGVFLSNDSPHYRSSLYLCKQPRTRTELKDATQFAG